MVSVFCNVLWFVEEGGELSILTAWWKKLSLSLLVLAWRLSFVFSMFRWRLLHRTEKISK